MHKKCKKRGKWPWTMWVWNTCLPVLISDAMTLSVLSAFFAERRVVYLLTRRQLNWEGVLRRYYWSHLDILSAFGIFLVKDLCSFSKKNAQYSARPIARQILTRNTKRREHVNVRLTIPTRNTFSLTLASSWQGKYLSFGKNCEQLRTKPFASIARTGETN